MPLNAYDLIDQPLPETEQELFEQIAAISAVSDTPHDRDPRYSLDRRFELVKRNALLQNMRRLFMKNKKDEWVSIRPFEEIRGVEPDSVIPLRNILGHLERIKPDDVEQVHADERAMQIIIQKVIRDAKILL